MPANVIPILGALNCDEPPAERKCEGCGSTVFVLQQTLEDIASGGDIAMVTCMACTRNAMAMMQGISGS